MFENDKFGTGALLSANLNADGYEVIQRHLQIGSKLLIRKSTKLSKTGGNTYFLEVLPPMDQAARGTSRAATLRTTGTDEI